MHKEFFGKTLKGRLWGSQNLAKFHFHPKTYLAITSSTKYQHINYRKYYFYFRLIIYRTTLVEWHTPQLSGHLTLITELSLSFEK